VSLVAVTPPVSYPVSVAEAKAQLNYAGSDQDTLIGSLIATATLHLEGRAGVLGRALLTQTWEMRIDQFPRSTRGRIEIPLPPLQSVTFVRYIDDTGSEATLDPALYTVETWHPMPRIRPAYGHVWPTARDEDSAVRIRFVAGYGTAADVPAPIKHAILLLVGTWFRDREATGEMTKPLAMGVDALTNPYRVWPV
jgi:uncharacterized phiE125 gp8 family phage protein